MNQWSSLSIVKVFSLLIALVITSDVVLGQTNEGNGYGKQGFKQIRGLGGAIDFHAARVKKIKRRLQVLRSRLKTLRPGSQEHKSTLSDIKKLEAIKIESLKFRPHSGISDQEKAKQGQDNFASSLDKDSTSKKNQEETFFKKTMHRFPELFRDAMLTKRVFLNSNYSLEHAFETFSLIGKVNERSIRTIHGFVLGRAVIAQAVNHIEVALIMRGTGSFSKNERKELRKKYAFLFRGKEARMLRKRLRKAQQLK